MAASTSTSSSLLSTMRAWTLTSTKGGAVQNLTLTTRPVPSLTTHGSPSTPTTPHTTLIRNGYTSLNPIDIKLATIPLLGRFLFPIGTTPGQELCGRVVSTTDPRFRPGQLVTTRLAQQSGALAQFVLAEGKVSIAAVPEGLSAAEAATAGTCGQLSVQILRPFAGKGGKERKTRVFINGGSGGAGSWMVQVGRAMGMEVVASCSGPNVEMVKGLGAEEVLDYRKVNVGKTLGDRVEAGSMGAFDAVIDTVGSPGRGLYNASERFLRPDGRFVQIGANISLQATWDVLLMGWFPPFLGGGKRRWALQAVANKSEDLETALKMMAEGKVKVPIDEVVPFEEASRGYEKLLSGRVKGKIVVRVGDEE